MAVAISSAGNETVTVCTVPVGQRIRVHSWLLATGGSVTLTFASGGGTPATGGMPSGTEGGHCAPHNSDGWFVTGDNTLTLAVDGSAAVGGLLNFSAVGL